MDKSKSKNVPAVGPIHIISSINSGDIYGGRDRHGRTRGMRWKGDVGLIGRVGDIFDRTGQRFTRIISRNPITGLGGISSHAFLPSHGTQPARILRMSRGILKDVAGLGAMTETPNVIRS